MNDNSALVIDIDGTLCPIKQSHEKYEDLIPDERMISKIREYKNKGFRIVLYTARNMKTHKNNIGLINTHTAPILLAWLKKWDIPFDEIHYGKPWPGEQGFYIDDRSVRPKEFLNNSYERLNQIMDNDRSKISLRNSSSNFLNIVITMAGMGSRFKEKGHNLPKYMIEVKGKTLFWWSLSSLKNFFSTPHKLFFICQKKDKATDFINHQCQKLSIKNFSIIEIDYLTDGQATTALLAKDNWESQSPLIIYNIDTYVNDSFLSPLQARGDGWIPCFNAPGTHWSFCRLNRSGRVEEVKEKIKISDYATIGLYWFSSAKLYQEAYSNYYEKKPNQLNMKEKYIAPLYNHLIKEGRETTISTIPFEAVYPLGTPEEVEQFNTLEL